MPRGGKVAALALAGTSLAFDRELGGLDRAGEAILDRGVGVRDWGAAAPAVGAAAARVTVRARLVASRRRREAGEPGRRWARRERWVAPGGGRASLEADACPGAATGRGSEVAVGEVQGLEGLGHLEDGSGQTGLRGCEAAPPRAAGLSFSLEVAFGSADGVRALRWRGPSGSPGLGDRLEAPPRGVEGREE